MRRFRRPVLPLALLGILAASAPILHAQEAGETAEAVKVSVFQLVLRHSGWPGAMILLMSVAAVYLIVRFAVELRRSRVLPEPLITALEEQLDRKRVKEAIQECNRSDSVLARLVKAGLMEVRSGYEAMEEALEEFGEAESVRMHQQVGWLSIIGAVAPMLGLTGTVLGMMGAFGTISASATQPSPAALAADIQLALVTTCEGLIVAVPVLLAYAAFRNRVTVLMLDAGVVASDLISRLKHVEITPSMVAGAREAARDKRTQAEQAAAPPPPPPPE